MGLESWKWSFGAPSNSAMEIKRYFNAICLKNKIYLKISIVNKMTTYESPRFYIGNQANIILARLVRTQEYLKVKIACPWCLMMLSGSYLFIFWFENILFEGSVYFLINLWELFVYSGYESSLKCIHWTYIFLVSFFFIHFMMPLDNIILTCNKFECIHSFLLIIILILRLYSRKNNAFLIHKKKSHPNPCNIYSLLAETWQMWLF